jgi:hypothetical protein
MYARYLDDMINELIKACRSFSLAEGASMIDAVRGAAEALRELATLHNVQEERISRHRLRSCGCRRTLARRSAASIAGRCS